MPVIKGKKTVTQDISGTGKTWTVAADARIRAEEMGIFEDNSSSNNRLKIFGAVTGVSTEEHPASTAVFTFGTGTRVDIAKSAVLKGNNGAVSYGDDSRIENAGTISVVDGLGIEINNWGGNGTIVNSGKVSAFTGIYVLLDAATITNQKGGSIFGERNGVVISATGDGTVLTNAGKITATADNGFAVLGGGHNDKVINSGRINGAIDLGAGVDTFDFRGGKLSEVVAGGEDNDTLILHKAGATLFEQADDGFDRVRSFVSYVLGDNVEVLTLLGRKELKGTGSDTNNEITGNTARNILKGMGGDDQLNGGKGNDTLNGGVGFDTFVLAKGTGKDTVIGFEDTIDHIFVRGYADFNDPSDVEGHIKQKGDDVWVQMSKTDILVLKGMDAANIDSDDFNFVM